MNGTKKAPSALLSEQDAAALYRRELSIFRHLAKGMDTIPEAQAQAAGQVARAQLAKCVALVQSKRNEYDEAICHWRKSPWDPLARKYVDVYGAKYEAASEILAALVDESAERAVKRGPAVRSAPTLRKRSSRRATG